MTKTVTEKAREQLLDVLCSGEITRWASKSFIYVDKHRDVDYHRDLWRINGRVVSVHDVLDALISAPPGYPKEVYALGEPSLDKLRKALAKYRKAVGQNNGTTSVQPASESGANMQDITTEVLEAEVKRRRDAEREAVESKRREVLDNLPGGYDKIFVGETRVAKKHYGGGYTYASGWRKFERCDVNDLIEFGFSIPVAI